MNLRQMEVFHAIMHEGSVTGAAQALGVSQPSVSEMLRLAEARIGLTLFERRHGRLHPTAEARSLFAEVEKVFEAVRRVHRAAAMLRDAETGLLRIASINALGLALAPRLLGRFAAAAPGIEGRLAILRRHELSEALLSGEFDLGLVFLSGQDPRLRRQELARRPLRCLVPEGHALAGRAGLTLRELVAAPLIGFSRLQTLHTLLRRIFAEAELAYRPVAEVEHIIQAWTMVQAGAGLAIVDPFSGIGPLFPGLREIPLLAPAELALEAIHSAERPLSLAAQAFLRHAGALLAEAGG
ncbi:LysR family transcriptional regulator [Teichococcus aerofrigidensis]